MNIQFKLLTETATPPTKHLYDDAGIDIFADEDCEVKP
jgi:hypothetical protein